MELKFGRKPPVHNIRTFRLGLTLARALDTLGAPPAVSAEYGYAVTVPWGTALNTSLGDCVIADSVHQVMLHTVPNSVVPTDAEIIAMYSAVGGYVPGDSSTDNGCNETAACRYLVNTGLAGIKTCATGPIEPTTLDHVRWAVELFGACRLGISVTDDMVSAFPSGSGWTRFTGNVVGGHDVPIVQYDEQNAYVVTWGKMWPVSWDLMADPRFLEEAHGEIWPGFDNAVKTQLPDLLSDLQLIETGS